MRKRLTTLALVAVATAGLSLTGCKSGDKADDANHDNGAETENNDG